MKAKRAKRHAGTRTLVAAVSDQATFLLEWAAYHRLVGFDRILVYSHACTDGSDAMLDLLAAEGLLEHHRNDDPAAGLPDEAEARAFARALPEAEDDAWLLPLGLREFLAVHPGGGRLDDLLAALPGSTAAVAIRTRLFGTSQTGEAAPGAPQLARFTAHAAETEHLAPRARAIRMLVRPEVAAKLGPRRAWFDRAALRRGRIRDGGGTDVTDTLLHKGWTLPAEAATLGLCQINDYALGTREDLLAATGADAVALEEALRRLDRNEARDAGLLRWQAPLMAETARLRAAMPRLAALEAEARDARAEAVAALRATLEAQDPVRARRLLTPPPAPDPRPVAPWWLHDLRGAAVRRQGFFRALPDHALVFVDRGPERLVVGFDNLASVREGDVARDGWGYAFAAARGWSYLGVLAHVPTWFRDPALHAALAELQRAGFFGDFRAVGMIGTSMGAFGACAFAPLAPGCRIVALSPQATLDPRKVPWEARWPTARRQDWDGPFASAPEGVAAAERAHLIYDPLEAADRRHIALFEGPAVRRLPLPLGGHKTALHLRNADVLWSVVETALTGDLTAASFATVRRQTRLSPVWLMPLARRLRAQGRQTRLDGVLAGVAAAGRPRLARYVADMAEPPPAATGDSDYG